VRRRDPTPHRIVPTAPASSRRPTAAVRRLPALSQLHPTARSNLTRALRTIASSPRAARPTSCTPATPPSNPPAAPCATATRLCAVAR
jgi:hypothetical protein